MRGSDLLGVLWWDREEDALGRKIRPDVRSAAHEVWSAACRQTEITIGDIGEAASLMEKSVLQVSRYLDRKKIPLFQADLTRLVLCAFIRSLRPLALKNRRVQLLGEIDELSAPHGNNFKENEIDIRLDAARIFSSLNPRVQQMHELRSAGFLWRDIANILGLNSISARAEYSRELKKMRKRFRPPGSD